MTELSNTGTLSIARAVDTYVILSVANKERGRHFRSRERQILATSIFQMQICEISNGGKLVATMCSRIEYSKSSRIEYSLDGKGITGINIVVC